MGDSLRYLCRGMQRSGSSVGDSRSQMLSGVCPSWNLEWSPHWVRMSTQSDLGRKRGEGQSQPPERGNRHGMQLSMLTTLSANGMGSFNEQMESLLTDLELRLCSHTPSHSEPGGDV